MKIISQRFRGVLFFLIFLALLFVGCAKRGIDVLAGQKIPGLNISISAGYDQSLDQLILGYKIITVALTNHDYSLFYLHPDKDRWWVVDDRGRKYEASPSLKDTDILTWKSLDESLRSKLSYSLIVPSGVTETVDLFVPVEVPLDRFRSLIFFSYYLNKTINIL